jgi:ADP-ribose pyrophosphatase
MRHSKLLKQEVLYNRWGKKFVVDTLQMEDGVVSDWSYVTGRNGSMIVALTADKKLILVKQYRYTLKQFTYENCAGGVEVGESDTEAASREFTEETGYKFDKLVSLGRYYDLPTETDHWCHIFLATDCQYVCAPTFDNDVEKYFEMSIEVHDFMEVYNSLGTKDSLLKSTEHSFAVFLAHQYLKKTGLI